MNNQLIQKEFISIDKYHTISTSIIDDIAWFQIIKADLSQYKTFFLLIKDCVDYFRLNNIKFIKQCVLSSDVPGFIHSEIVEINESMVTITTPITKFIDELVNALGIVLI